MNLLGKRKRNSGLRVSGNGHRSDQVGREEWMKRIWEEALRVNVET